ncbi:MAG: DNA translocase FtsK [Victivallaceae bacterium]
MARTIQETVKPPEEAVGVFKFRYCFYIIAALFILLALFSHDPGDFAVIQGGNDTPVSNWIGEVGARLSCALLYMFGLAAYPIVFILVACALRSLLPLPTSRRGYSGMLLLLILGITVLFAIHPQSFTNQTDALGIGRKEIPNSALSGGVIGQVLAGPESSSIPPGYVRRFIGTIGTIIAASVFVLAGLVLIWFADWQPAIRWLLALNPQPRDDESEETKVMEPVKETKETKTAKETKEAREAKLRQEEKDRDAAEEALLELRRQSLEIKENAAKVEKEQVPAKVEPVEPVVPVVPVPEPVIESRLQKTEKIEEFADEPKHSPVQPRRKSSGNFELPSVFMLSKGKESSGEKAESIERSKQILQKTLESFNVEGQVAGIISGPRVTRFEVSLAPGVKVDKVANIEGNIAMELEAESIRILAPIPGRNAVGVEVPNSIAEAVYMRAIMETDQWKNSKYELPIVLGKDVSGRPVILDLAKAPHLLIAGSTGSGKSVCMNTLIMSLLLKFSPEDLRMIMVDPKIVEMATYAPLPHLITPVVNDAHKVPLALRWAVNEMEKRYRMLAKVKTKNLAGFNSRPVEQEPVLDDSGEPIPEKLPFLILIIDELADVMMTDAKSDVETSIARIAQKGRAAGIHIVIATQRPSVNIITGVIKANLPTRIAFKVGSIVDSRVILDQKGAEKLLGRGDMLFMPPGSVNMERIQGAMVEDQDIAKVVEFVSSQADQDFDHKVISEDAAEEEEEDDGEASIYDAKEISPLLVKYLEPGDDELIKKSMEIILLEQKASTSYLQRRLKIGYNRAAEIMDKFEQRGLVSPPLPGGSKRDILVTVGIAND